MSGMGKGCPVQFLGPCPDVDDTVEQIQPVDFVLSRHKYQLLPLNRSQGCLPYPVTWAKVLASVVAMINSAILNIVVRMIFLLGDLPAGWGGEWEGSVEGEEKMRAPIHSDRRASPQLAHTTPRRRRLDTGPRSLMRTSW